MSQGAAVSAKKHMSRAGVMVVPPDLARPLVADCP
jgi:hypothetical protein